MPPQPKPRVPTVTIRKADLHSSPDKRAFDMLLAAYMSDPKGDMSGRARPQKDVADKLQRYPHASVFFAEVDGASVGMAVCFTGFSTFHAKPLLNIHDLIVLEDYRRQGIGKQLLTAIEQYGRSISCCKVTLEVRDDNRAAQALYREMGFDDEPVPMRFWVKGL